MNRKPMLFLGATFLPVLLSGCSSTASKNTSISVIYAVAVFLSLVLLIGYCVLVQQKDKWFYLLFSSVLTVNMGYLALSAAKTTEWALHCNRLAYLGSVFLPLAMLMIILNVCEIKCGRFAVIVLFAVSIAVFLITASPGYLDIYYKFAELRCENSVTYLYKEYGPLHIVYLIYLMAHFSAMITVIVYSTVKKKLKSHAHAAILLVAVGCNIGVWFLEKFIDTDFEFLSVSYIITELFFIGLYLMIQELKKQEQSPVISTPAVPESPDIPKTEESEEDCSYFESQLCKLTPTEQSVYDLYLQGKGTKEVLEILNIKENTLKYHNKNIYSKLGVNSRKQLIEIARRINAKRSD